MGACIRAAAARADICRLIWTTASRNDEYATLDFSRRVARRWQSDFIDIGELGHINAASGIGHWPAGLALLSRTIVRAGFGREERAARVERTWAPATESIRAAA